MFSKIGSNINSAVKKVFNAAKQVNDDKERIVRKISRKANNTFGTNTPTVSTNKNSGEKMVKLGEKSERTTDNKRSVLEEKRFKNPLTTSLQTINVSDLTKLDVVKELPKITEKQIGKIIGKHFANSPVISTKDAKDIYEAQMKSGMSALAVLGIGALESAFGTSNIAKKKGNLWGWNATNTNPIGDAKTFSSGGEGAYEYSNNFLNTYYDKYGAKTIYSAGTGDNPAGKGYAYHEVNGELVPNPEWVNAVGNIMHIFYNTAFGKD